MLITHYEQSCIPCPLFRQHRYDPAFFPILLQIHQCRISQDDVWRILFRRLQRESDSDRSFPIGKDYGWRLDDHVMRIWFEKCDERLEPPLSPEFPETLMNTLACFYGCVSPDAGI